MSIKKWMLNARSIALAQSVMPALLAVALAWKCEAFRFWDAALAVLGVAFAHLAMNLSDDYFDYKADVLGDRDKVQRQGFRAMMHKYPYLTDGSESLRSTAKVIAIFVGLALLCGLVIVWDRWENGIWGEQGLWWIAAIVFSCGFLGVFYSAPPLKLAYRGLGELVIAFIFGPLLMMGVYYASAGQIAWEVVLISVPVGLLVLNILFTHSFIDMKGDEQCNKMTFARLLKSRRANLVASFIFIFLPFALVILGVCLGVLAWPYLAVLLVLPRGIWLFRSLRDYSQGKNVTMDKAPKVIGSIPDWENYKKAGIEWFMLRWLCARNLLAGFCLLSIVVSIVLKYWII